MGRKKFIKKILLGGWGGGKRRGSGKRFMGNHTFGEDSEEENQGDVEVCGGQRKILCTEEDSKY